MGSDGRPMVRQRRPQRVKPKRTVTPFFDSTDVVYILMIFIAPVAAFFLCRALAESNRVKPVLEPMLGGAVEVYNNLPPLILPSAGLRVLHFHFTSRVSQAASACRAKP